MASPPSQTPKHAPVLSQLQFPIVIFGQSEFDELGVGFGVCVVLGLIVYATR